MNKLLYLLLGLIFYCCSNNSQNKCNGANDVNKDPALVIRENQTLLYSFDTILSNGYSLKYTSDDSLQHLFLKKDGVIKEISRSSLATAQKELGYVGMDFTNWFLLLHSFESGTVDFGELIEKKTGDMIVSGFYIDADQKKELLLYGQIDPASTEENMVLYNIKTKEKKTYDYPKGITFIPKEKAIKIHDLSNHTLTISYQTPQGVKKKIYNK
jgi:hypothetical protein